MDKQQKIIIAILLVLLLALIVATAVVLTVRSRDTVIADFEAPPFDKSAVLGVPVVDDSLNYRDITVAEGFNFSMCGNLTLKNNGCLVYFTSPADNEVWLLMKIYDGAGDLLGQSGLLRPGEYLESIALSRSVSSSIPVRVRILSYEPDTYLSQGSAEASFRLTVSE